MSESVQTVRIAIVDPQPIFRDSLRTILEAEDDFEVVSEAGTVEQALNRLREFEPDVLLLEISGEKWEGFSILQSLQEVHFATKPVALTAAESCALIFPAIEHGARGVLFKEMATPLLLEAIRKVSGGGIWFDFESINTIVQEFTQSLDFFGGRTLTERQCHILKLIATGRKNKDSASGQAPSPSGPPFPIRSYDPDPSAIPPFEIRLITEGNAPLVA